MGGISGFQNSATSSVKNTGKIKNLEIFRHRYLFINISWTLQNIEYALNWADLKKKKWVNIAVLLKERGL